MSTDMVLTGTEQLPDDPASSCKWKIPAEALPAIAQRYRRGEALQSIAETYGVTDDAVRRRLEKWAVSGQGDEHYEDLGTEFLVEKALGAKDRLVEARDMVGVARAREETKFWQWILERRRSKLFGQKHEMGEGQKIMVVVNR